jgi:hypothetical protein
MKSGTLKFFFSSCSYVNYTTSITNPAIKIEVRVVYTLFIVALDVETEELHKNLIFRKTSITCQLLMN